MRLVHTVKNEHETDLVVSLEPWATPYKLRSGSTLMLRYRAASENAARVDAQLGPWGLILWFNNAFEPEAEIDGHAAEPAWD